MALRLVSLLVTLVLMGVLATTMRDRLSPDEKSSAKPQSLLQTAGLILERSHQITGTYAGAVIEGDSALRLVSADANAYCLQLEWIDRSVYRLRGPGGSPEAGAC
jgi:hypothetical protein